MYFKSTKNPCYFIAEVGSNHEGSFKRAKKLVIEAAKSNADLVKIQIYSSKNMVNKKFDLKRYKHFLKLELTVKEYIKLAKICRTYKKKFSASVWDENVIKELNKYIDIYKVGSGDLDNYQIIKKIIKTQKPIIISCGLANLEEIQKTINFINKIDKNYLIKKKIAILHCNTAYPTPFEDVNLKNINFLKKKFNLDIGYSDHTIGSEAIKVAYCFGAKIIEKHFSNTLKSKSFRDHQISLDRKGVNKYLSQISKYKKLLNYKKNKLTKSEILQKNRFSFRRSIYAKEKIEKGQLFSNENITCLRPLKINGIPASKYFNLIGKKSKRNFKIHDLIK